MEVYNCLNDIPDNSEKGFLYILNCDYYEQDLTLKLEDNVLKIGKTNTFIKTRLSHYKTNIKNISFVNCNVPDKRERLLKAFIKQKMNIKPVCGSEYFKHDRETLSKLILYFANEDESIIIDNHSKYEEDKTLEWFDTVYDNLTLDKLICQTTPLKKITNEFKCDYCNFSFTCNRNLLRHLRTIKPCCDKSKESNIKCIWCEQTFLTNIQLDKHECLSNKEALLISYIEKLKSKDDIIKEKDNMIKDLQDKLYNLALKNVNKNVNNNPIQLNCSYPLLLEYDKVFNMMKTHISKYINEGGKGVAKWFLNHLCKNEEGDICIECTDKSRKVFKYIDDENKLRKVTGEELDRMILKASEELKDIEIAEGKNETETTLHLLRNLKYKKSFLNELAYETHTD